MMIESRPIDAKDLSNKIHEYMRDYPNATARLTACRAILSMLGDANQTPTLSTHHIDKNKWPQCTLCKGCYNCVHSLEEEPRESCKTCMWGENHKPISRYCHRCGRPLTDEAWDELEKRMRG